MLKYLCLGAKADDAVFDEIWAWEAVNHGSSAVVNDTNLCPLCEFLGFHQLSKSDFVKTTGRIIHAIC